MKKYIRLKDNSYKNLIGEVVEEIDYYYKVKYLHMLNGEILLSKFVKKEEVMICADTIEELCDRYVEIMKNGKPVIYPLECKNALNKLLNKKKEIAMVYGAIWCEWGLKYVARMNSEGVLELL